VEDLETGSLLSEERIQGEGLNMPSLITDFDRFLAVLFEAWKKIPV
jgi:hypothetical protein